MVCSGRAVKAFSLAFSSPFGLDGCAVLAAQSCLTLCDPMDCSWPGSSVRRILQAKILELPFPSPLDEMSGFQNDVCTSPRSGSRWGYLFCTLGF